MASDLARAETFYKSPFGWGTTDDPRYIEWTLGGRSIGGPTRPGVSFSAAYQPAFALT